MTTVILFIIILVVAIFAVFYVKKIFNFDFSDTIRIDEIDITQDVHEALLQSNY